MKRSTRITAVAALAAAGVALTVAAPSAWAARAKTPTTTTGSSIWLASVNDINMGGPVTAATAWSQPELRLGDEVRFGSTVEPLAGREYPMVAVSCYQDVDKNG